MSTSTVTVIAESRAGERMELHLVGGAAVVDACDAAGAPIQFCCRSASCGTCRVEVLQGSAELEPPAHDELLLLAVFDADPARVRLACQLQVCERDSGVAEPRSLVHVRALED